MAMRAVWITRPGGPGALEVLETADPEPGPGQVRIGVRAAGLNFAEVMAAQGLYPDAPKPPCVVGYEVAGVVDALGERVPGLAAGQRVLAMTHFGGHADVVCVPAEQVLPIPDAMSFEEAAALPVNYLTAYHMLFRVAAVRPGERVLVHMAAGGVGRRYCSSAARWTTWRSSVRPQPPSTGCCGPKAARTRSTTTPPTTPPRSAV